MEKKRREYEKRGEDPPPYDAMVGMVRSETKAKELQQKALQNGEIDPGTSIVPSIETLPKYNTAKPPPGPRASTTGEADTSAGPARKASSPKPSKRTDKSPSPVPPLEFFTEEQLKKPNGTYVTILDEILQAHPDGEADLPDIYLRIQKRYPHFKYGVPTSGWQSSVRHNLLQHDRFTEKGKSGKGKFWAIDWSIPIEREQKKKKIDTSLPRHAQQPGQYGQQQYGNTYGNSQFNGQAHGANHPGSAYSSPYAQPGQHAQYGGRHSQQGPSNANAQRSNGAQPSVPQTLWELMIQEFLRLHAKYQETFRGHSDEVVARKEKLWEEALNLLSDVFHKGESATINLPSPGDQEDSKMLAELRDLFTNDRLREAARQQYMTGQDVQPTVNQAVENGAASVAEATQPNGGPFTNGTIAGAPDTAAQTGAPEPPPAVQAASHPNTSSGGVAGGRVSEPAVFGPSMDSQQLPPGGAGTKRSVDDAGDEPDAKRFKGEY